MGLHLLVLTGPDKGRRFPIGQEPLLIGRSKTTATQLNDPRCSKVHCRVQYEGDHLVITDQASTAGTFVNSQRVSRQELHLGDVITLGETQLLVESDVSEQPTIMGLPSPATTSAPTPSRPQVQNLADLVGKTLHHFQIGALVARGHSGIVFEARDLQANRRVAFKVLKPEMARNEEAMQRFIRATKTMMPLRHPNLVTIYGAGKTGPFCWISMEFVEGESLTQVINRIGIAGMLDWRHALRVAIHIARALDYAQQHNIIHRNITPQNILIQTNDRLTKLADMMLAKALEGAQAKDITTAGQLLGDIRYLPPERTEPGMEIDGRGDIYCLGATVYALLTGQPPFEGKTLMETLNKLRTEEPLKPRRYQLSIPEKFETLVLRMLARRPEERHPSAAELLKDLDQIAQECGLTF